MSDIGCTPCQEVIDLAELVSWSAWDWDREAQAASGSTMSQAARNTIMLVEASEEAAVPWTKPEDLDIDFANPLNKLSSNATPGIFQALFGDGSVRAISVSVDVNVLNALFTRAGGEVTNGF